MRLTLLIFNITIILFSLDQAQAEQQSKSLIRQINVDKYGNFSVEIRQMPLLDVVHAIKSQTNIKFKIRTTGNPKITCRFGDLSLNQGLKKLFRNFDYVFIEAEGKIDHSAPGIDSIILLNSNMKSDTVSQVDKQGIPEITAQNYSELSSHELTQQKVIPDMGDTETQVDLSHISSILTGESDENVRVAAVQALASQDSEKRVSILFETLNDESEKVRNQVVTTLGNIDTEAASDAFRTAVDHVDLP